MAENRKQRAQRQKTIWDTPAMWAKKLKAQRQTLVLKHTDEVLKLYVTNGLNRAMHWRSKIAKQLHIDTKIVQAVVSEEYKRLRKAAGLDRHMGSAR